MATNGTKRRLAGLEAVVWRRRRDEAEQALRDVWAQLSNDELEHFIAALEAEIAGRESEWTPEQAAAVAKWERVGGPAAGALWIATLTPAETQEIDRWAGQQFKGETWLDQERD